MRLRTANLIGQSLLPDRRLHFQILQHVLEEARGGLAANLKLMEDGLGGALSCRRGVRGRNRNSCVCVCLFGSPSTLLVSFAFLFVFAGIFVFWPVSLYEKV